MFYPISGLSKIFFVNYKFSVQIMVIVNVQKGYRSKHITF
jgi:hypothetical protein